MIFPFCFSKTRNSYLTWMDYHHSGEKDPYLVDPKSTNLFGWSKYWYMSFFNSIVFLHIWVMCYCLKIRAIGWFTFYALLLIYNKNWFFKFKVNTTNMLASKNMIFVKFYWEFARNYKPLISTICQKPWPGVMIYCWFRFS